MSEKLLSLAREVGATVRSGGKREDGSEFYPGTVTVMHAELAALEQRIRQDERERILKLVDAVRRVLQRELGAGEWMDCLEASIRSSGTSGSKSDE